MAPTLDRWTEQFVEMYFGLMRGVPSIPMMRQSSRLSTDNVWIDYDKEADVLYISFRKPQRASKTIEATEDVLFHKDGKTIVGVTIMNASTRA